MDAPLYPKKIEKQKPKMLLFFHELKLETIGLTTCNEHNYYILTSV